jgi:hypothetical protein
VDEPAKDLVHAVDRPGCRGGKPQKGFATCSFEAIDHHFGPGRAVSPDLTGWQPAERVAGFMQARRHKFPVEARAPDAGLIHASLPPCLMPARAGIGAIDFAYIHLYF